MPNVINNQNTNNQSNQNNQSNENGSEQNIKGDAGVSQEQSNNENNVQQPVDIISRVTDPTSVKKEDAEKKSESNDDKIAFDPKMIEQIRDPQARKFAEEAYKSFQSDYTRKTQALSEERKKLEESMQNMTQDQKDQMAVDLAKMNFSEKEINDLLKNPSFIQMANTIAGSENNTSDVPQGFTKEQWEYLSDEEQSLFKQQISAMNEQQKKIQGLYDKFQQMENQALDSQLMQKYKNYQPDRINEIRQELLSGKVQATNEHLYKAFYHDENVQRAYELGMQDGQAGNRERKDALGIQAGITNTQSSEEKPKRQPGESTQDFFRRLSEFNKRIFEKSGQKR